MKKIYTYLAMFVAAATMVACENAPEGNVTPDATGKPINITIGAQNRALLDLTDGKSVTWEAGDQIGLYHKAGDNVATADAAYTAASDGESTTFTGEATWSGSAEDAHEFYVYYPRRGDANSSDPTKIAKTISTKQYYDAAGSWENFGTDYSFAYAKANEVTYGGEVTFPALKQFFGIFRLHITNATGEKIVINDVVLTSNDGYLQGTHRIDITQDPATWTITTNSNKITCYVENGTVEAGESIDVRFAISPQDYTGKKFTVVVNSDKGTHPAVEFDAKKVGLGGRVSKNIELKAISHWIGDVVDGGVLFWMSPDHTKGKVLWPYGEILGWATAKLDVPEAVDKEDGTVNVAAMKAYATANSIDFAETFLAAAYCDAITANGGGWYLPAQNELVDLFEAYNGTEAGKATDAAHESVTDAEKAARAAFEGYILACAADGVILDIKKGNGDSAFASNQSSASNAVYVRWGKYSCSNGPKTSTSRYARCIKVVELTE